MPIIHIDKLVSFAPNVGVLVQREALSTSPNRLFEAVKLAYSHMSNKALVDACCGGSGLLAQYAELHFEEYLRLLNNIRVSEAGTKAKRIHTKVRRKEFNAMRSHLVLAMLDSGVPYVCAVPGCQVSDHLTIDHIKPLSRGGIDELSNLRFLCNQHNSLKSDKHEL